MKLKALLFLLLLNSVCHGQADGSKEISLHISKVMKDSLLLNDFQQAQIFQINLYLHEEKSVVWHKWAGQDSVLRYNLQLVENGRDSLYRPVLGELKYSIYKRKKAVLINNN